MLRGQTSAELSSSKPEIMKSLIAFSLFISATFFYYQGNITRAVCFGFLSVSLMLYDNSKGYKFPPSPFALPLVGHLPWMIVQDRHKYLLNLHERYGSMVTMKLGAVKNVIIGDYDTIKEFSNHPDFQGRPDFGIFHEVAAGNGVVDSEGERWKHLRRFVIHALRDAGMGKLKVEEKITEELHNLTEVLRQKGQKPFSFDTMVHRVTCNVIYNVAFDLRFDYDDPGFIDRINRLNENFQMLGILGLISLFPWLSLLARPSMKKLLRNSSVFEKESHSIVQEHMKILDENNPRDLVDLFLVEMNRSGSSDEDKEHLEHFTTVQLKRIIVDVFGAGTETSSSTIRWAIAYMIKHPEIQQKVQAEIDEVIGYDRSPTMEDKYRLPFTSAALQEVERLGSIAPNAVPRSNPEAAKFKGFTFLPRVMFGLNIYAVHRDPKLWKNPDEFDPSRFIDSEGKVFRPPHLMPFGSGRRVCAGESLAKMEIFLIFVTLMQQFQFLPPNEKPFKIKPNLSGFVHVPIPFDVRVKSRV